jgi:regulator of RNase E activity RraA
MTPKQLADLLSRLARLDTSSLSDALDVIGVDGVVTGLPPAWRSEAIAGRVIPVRLVPDDHTTRTRHHLGAAAIEAGGPGDVIVVDNQGRTEMGGWGGLLARAALAKGVEGVILDGACRDVEEIEEIGLPVFARGATARTARRRVVEQPADEILVGMITVKRGDLLRADRTAIVFIPEQLAGDVITAAERITERESVMADALARGFAPTSVLGADYEELLSRMADADEAAGD